MITVNTSHQKFENKNSCGELTWNKNSFTLPLSQTSQKSSKKFSKIQNHTHILLHKPALIPKYFSKKSTKTPFGGHFLVI